MKKPKNDVEISCETLTGSTCGQFVHHWMSGIGFDMFKQNELLDRLLDETDMHTTKDTNRIDITTNPKLHLMSYAEMDSMFKIFITNNRLLEYVYTTTAWKNVEIPPICRHLPIWIRYNRYYFDLEQQFQKDIACRKIVLLMQNFFWGYVYHLEHSPQLFESVAYSDILVDTKGV